MPQRSWFVVTGLAAGLALTALHAGETHGSAALPDAVAGAFKSAFPNAQTTSVDAEKEGGLTVYDLEFTEDGLHRECDMTADGTILSTETTIELSAVPDVVMRAFVKAAEGGVIGRVEYGEIRAEAKHGKIVALSAVRIEYEAELTKGDRAGEVTVGSDGKIVEGPKWFKPGEDGD